MNAATDRILAQLGDNELIEKLLNLSKSDFTSLLLEVFNRQSEEITPTDVLKQFEKNRYTVPSELDPVAYHLLEAEFLKLAQKMDIQTILLSPASPFAGCSAFGCVNQNNVVSAIRGTEILSDPTNMLAIIIAENTKNKKINSDTDVHYCTTARVLRAQPFPAVKGYYSHFGIFCIVSRGKDTGSYNCEKTLLTKQLSYYRALFKDKYNANISIAIRKRSGYVDDIGFIAGMTELIKSELPDVPVSINTEDSDNNYYKGINYSIFMENENSKVEIGDGGFVDWMQKMTGNKKERCLLSGIGLDRLLI